MDYPTQSSLSLTLHFVKQKLAEAESRVTVRLKLSPMNDRSLPMTILTAWKKLSMDLVLATG